MTDAPVVLVTATSEVVDGHSVISVNEAYVAALLAAGLIPVMLPPLAPELASAALGGAAGLVLTGGGEDIDPRHYGEDPHPATGSPHRARDISEISLARAAYEHRVPTFGICRGAQIVNVALGGTLIPDITREHARGTARVHDVEREPSSRLTTMVGASCVRVSSTHHQAIGRPAPGIRVVGTSPDGVVEAIEFADDAWWMIGVQWRSENLVETPEDWDRRLFAAFAGIVRRNAAVLDHR